MKKLISIGLFLFLFCGQAAANSPNYALLAQRQVRALNNYTELTKTQVSELEQKAIKWLVKIKQVKDIDHENVMPSDYLNIYTGLVHQTYRKREINVLPGLGISYVPDLELYYAIYLKYYEFMLQYGKDTPLPEVIMAMLNQETRFLWITGDNGHSIAPCQLHRATAKWLLSSKKYKKRFGELIYFDDAGKGQVLSPDIFFGKPYIIKDKDTYVFAYFRENLDTTVFYHNKIIEQQSGLKPYYTQEELDTNFIYLYYEVHDQKGELKERHFITSVEQYKNIASKVTVQSNKIAGKIYTIPNYPVYYEKVADNSVAPPSFFVDDEYVIPSIKSINTE